MGRRILSSRQCRNCGNATHQSRAECFNQCSKTTCFVLLLHSKGLLLQLADLFLIPVGSIFGRTGTFETLNLIPDIVKRPKQVIWHRSRQ